MKYKVTNPFELKIFDHGQYIECRQFESLDAAMAAVASLRPSKSYKLSVVLMERVVK
jgi:hypothetical protein